MAQILTAWGQNYTHSTFPCAYMHKWKTEKMLHESNRKQTFIKKALVDSCFFDQFDMFLFSISFSETGKYLHMRWQRSWARFRPRMLQLCGASCRPMSHQKTTFSTSYLKRNVRKMLVIIFHWSSVALRGSQRVIGLCDCIFWLCLRGMRWKEGSEILITLPFVSCCALPCSLLNISFKMFWLSVLENFKENINYRKCL